MSIRIATIGDLPAMLEIYRPFVEETAVSFEYTTPTAEEFALRFQQITARFPWLVWEEDGAVLGYAYAAAPFERAAFSWCAEPSIYLAPQARGRGVGRQLYEALEDILTKQGYQVLYALVTTENAPSVAFHRALGYRRLADFPDCGFKCGKWHGIIWLEKRLKAVEMPDIMPTPFPAIGNSNQK